MRKILPMGIVRLILRNIKKVKCLNRIRKIHRTNNQVFIDDNLYGNVVLDIRGNNNVVTLANLRMNDNSTIYINIFGNNNVITIEDVSISKFLKIDIGLNHRNFGEVNGSKFCIGKGTSIEDMWYCTYNSGSYCNIGSRCMISFDVVLYNTDAHPVMYRENMQVINKVKGISIGDHCWIGQKASVLKNTTIPDNCIIGYGAVVSGTMKQQYAAYAGNPAKCIKTGIVWDSNGRKNGYIENEID